VICILSQSGFEGTTELVTQWLRGWRLPVVRLNAGDVSSRGGSEISLTSSGTRFTIRIDDQTLDPAEVEVVWCRRWGYGGRYHSAQVFVTPGHQDRHNTRAVTEHLTRELETVGGFLFSLLDHAEWLGHPSTSMLNKLEVLQTAAACGLAVPDTLVTDNLDQVRAFARRHGSAVTKALSELVMCKFDEWDFATYTSDVSEAMLQESEWRAGFPSLFQEKLDKKYEIRSFYLDGVFYSMAMFSQRHPETMTDFRRYQHDDPTRWVPFRLPDEIEQKLRRLMKDLRLDTGSLDIVRTVDGRYVFLEVNPVGQFGMVSQPCNYYLEKKVAARLAERYHARTDSSICN
jgi:ATP-GRASP peptide maturase of grasp-with-spasm system